jgi:hypothetical protein
MKMKIKRESIRKAVAGILAFIVGALILIPHQTSSMHQYHLGEPG